MSFTIAEGHPRVLVRPGDLPKLRHKAATTHAAEMKSLVALAEAGIEPSVADPSADVVRLAFLYLLSGESAHAKAAIAGLERVLRLEVSGEYFTGARRLKALAMSYDWLHGAMGEELRKRVGERALAYCQALYDTGEVEPGCYLLGHAINQMPFILMAAVGIGDELPGARRFVDDTMDRTEKQLAGYRAFLERDCFQQSYSYTSTYVGEFAWLFTAIEAGLGVEMFRTNPWIANVVKWWTHALRDDETFLRFGDYFCAIPLFENPQYFRTLACVAARYGDGRAQWWVKRFKLKGAEVDQFLFEERPGVAVAEPGDLPRTRLFDAMGIAIARGDFEAGSTVASFKCTPVYLHNHAHRDANSFTIYHKGDQAIDSGAYDSYETPHWYNYYVRTIAHNTMVVHDPQERFVSRGREYANDGGQRWVNEPHFQPVTLEDTRLEAFRDGKIIAYRDGEGFSYVCGDASNCYRKEKVKRFLRHVTFVLDWPQPRCVSLVVLDEIEVARAGLEPRFLLHTIEEPRVDGNRVLSRHKGGRLTTTFLLPREPKVEKVGGEGREFEVEGKNYPLNRKMVGPHTPGAWRVEMSGGEGLVRRFLTVLTPGDVEGPREAEVTFEESAGGYVVRQGDLRVVLVRQGQPQVVPKDGRVVRVELAS